MAVTIHVNGKSNSLVHKGGVWIAKCTLPDVCKTPSPGGPIPIPYPVIMSTSKDLAKGTKTVEVDGKNPAAIKGSEFSRCIGDEPGTAGGIKSSTNMKEATWLLYSFDVKLDGKNACRLSDKMMMNHGNTVCLSGNTGIPVQGATISRECTEAVETMDKVLNGSSTNKSIKQREQELKANPQNQSMWWADANPGQPRPSGSDQWGHLIAIEQQQKQLINAQEGYYKNGCTNAPPGMLDEAADWSMRSPIEML